MTSIIKFTVLSGAKNESPPCYLLQVDNFRFLLDCGWDESFSMKIIDNIKKYGVHYMERSLHCIYCTLHNLLQTCVVAGIINFVLLLLHVDNSKRKILQAGWLYTQVVEFKSLSFI